MVAGEVAAAWIGAIFRSSSPLLLLYLSQSILNLSPNQVSVTRRIVMAISVEKTYLLGRIPNLYSLQENREKLKEPVRVLRARQIIKDYEDRCKEANSIAAAKLQREINAAKEAVYFSTPDKAMVLIKRLEALKKR
jgi:hypothetical protein